MLSLLETLLTWVGFMLILALAAQSLQEIVKIAFALKGQAAMHGLRRLIRESAKSVGLPAAGDSIVTAVIERLRGLGQNGFLRSSVRLDALTADLLRELVQSADPARIEGLRPLDDPTGQGRLVAVAAQVARWYPLAMNPVEARYRRRMRALALATSAVVVWAANADAFQILSRSRNDSAFQQAVASRLSNLDSLMQRAKRAQEACAAATRSGAPSDSAASAGAPTAAGTTDTTALPQAVACDTARAVADTVRSAGLGVLLDQSFPLGTRRPKEWTWWAGLALSTLLVSLGAPFWHDALESLLGLKNRIRAQVKETKAEAAATAATAAIAETRREATPNP